MDAGNPANNDALANEGEVVAATGSIGDRRAAIGGNAERGGVADAAAVNRNRAAPGVANADGVAGIAAAVYITDGNSAAIGGSGCDAAITSRSGVGKLHDLPSLCVQPWPLNPTLSDRNVNRSAVDILPATHEQGTIRWRACQWAYTKYVLVLDSFTANVRILGTRVPVSGSVYGAIICVDMERNPPRAKPSGKLVSRGQYRLVQRGIRGSNS